MKRFWVFSFIAAAFAFTTLLDRPLIARAQPAAPCSLARITMITMPKGSAKYQAGVLRLSNGGSLQLVGAQDSPAMYPITQMRANDAVAACYSRLNHYADAGPSRTITILDLRTSGFYGSLTGTWPPR